MNIWHLQFPLYERKGENVARNWFYQQAECPSVTNNDENTSDSLHECFVCVHHKLTTSHTFISLYLLCITTDLRKPLLLPCHGRSLRSGHMPKFKPLISGRSKMLLAQNYQGYGPLPFYDGCH